MFDLAVRLEDVAFILDNYMPSKKLGEKEK